MALEGLKHITGLGRVLAGVPQVSSIGRFQRARLGSWWSHGFKFRKRKQNSRAGISVTFQCASIIFANVP